MKVERLKLIKQLTKEIRNPTECYFTFYLLYLLEFIFLRKEKDLSVFGLWSVNVGAETPSCLIKRLSSDFQFNKPWREGREGRKGEGRGKSQTL